jgi:hypothetical protein
VIDFRPSGGVQSTRAQTITLHAAPRNPPAAHDPALRDGLPGDTHRRTTPTL